MNVYTTLYYILYKDILVCLKWCFFFFLIHDNIKTAFSLHHFLLCNSHNEALCVNHLPVKQTYNIHIHLGCTVLSIVIRGAGLSMQARKSVKKTGKLFSMFYFWYNYQIIELCPVVGLLTNNVLGCPRFDSTQWRICTVPGRSNQALDKCFVDQQYLSWPENPIQSLICYG